MCRCEPAEIDGQPYVRWAAEWFGDCLYTSRDYSSFIIGLSSIFFWLWCQMPQFFENWRNGNADALSPYFLLIWLLGDSANMIGAILTQQLPTQQVTAIYFVSCDIIMVVQYIYYYFKNHVNKERESIVSGNTYGTAKGGNRANMFGLGLMTLTVASRAALSLGGSSAPSALTGRVLLQSPEEPICGAPGPDWQVLLGTVIGWGSAVLYLTSRMPQIVKNYQRKSVEGLSLGMFLSAVMGNLTYASSIFVRNMDAQYLWDRFPWLLGSVGTFLFDFTVFCQFHYYRNHGNQYERIPTDMERGK
mmetsp:Transcript_19725/g.33881  ORF Transcript_19725/g.33881 Transcript_19725/m.33881 type:complete len:303 (+) Transcript_19725:91-999(+)|eukprot:CAMPEP_0196661352 /NCGR_PEP_ID=MMETSP1086-20130531/43812_1 /TAXON_ID=77921 /ORGANISM="Cyanoptyche  gloeocystis , Strain SAG4.97" /LENGTH=302 /DNA_ID=CAMNT_0041996197 /DNA_START=71 /DNA_END=979 /DNA_ORIENTATION=+